MKIVIENTIILAKLLVHGLRIIWHVYVYIPIHPKIYKPLCKFKDIHKGQRCFIVATGPSLTLEDVNKLKGEICFGMNSVMKMFDKTDWRPTYYALFDGSVYDRIKEELYKIDSICSFCADNLPWRGDNVNLLGMWGGWRYNSKIERMIFPDSLQEKQLRISSDISKYVYAGSSVVHMIMQVCFYMGFSEIYIIGADCNFGGSAKHSSLLNYNALITETPEYLYYALMRDYERAKKYADRYGIKIYNATRGGMLEKFERVDLDEVLK